MLALVGVLTLVVLGAGAYRYLKHSHPATAVVAGPIVALPQVTLNLADGHLLQVIPALQTTSATNQRQLSTLQPRLIDVTITVLGAYSESRLLAPGGRAAAKTALLAAYEAILSPARPGSPVQTAVTAKKTDRAASVVPVAEPLLAVYFTQFLMQ